MWLFLTAGAVNKNIKSKKNSADNRRHNILRRFDILINFLFTTSDTECHY